MNEGTSVYSLMQTGKPYKSYIKTIVGKVFVNVWDSFQNKPIGIIVAGNPGSNPEDCIIDVWNEQEDMYFKRANKRHFETGFIIAHTRSEVEPERSPNDLTDDELNNLLNSRFLSLQSGVNKMTSVAPVFRMITMAKEQEKSEKIIKFLEGKLSELQLREYNFEEA